MPIKGHRPLETGASGLLETFVDNYSDGFIRALAQEPVQNAKDARILNQIVRVEYRLLRRLGKDGRPCYTLTVTDSGTTGLSGKPFPSKDELDRATEEERKKLKWHHFERLHDSNKGKLDSGSRGWGKLVFLHCSHMPGEKRSALMIYDTLLSDKEYRLGHIVMLENEFGVRKEPLLNRKACEAIEAPSYVTANDRINVPLGLKPLAHVGTRVIVPHLSKSAVKAIRDSSLDQWLKYLWWRLIADGTLELSIVDEELDEYRTIGVPKWWAEEEWSSDVTTPGAPRKLHEGCFVLVLENEELPQDCRIRHLALKYDAGLNDEVAPGNTLNYVGIQMMRSGQCIETYWDFDQIPRDGKSCFRGFVEFDKSTDAQLRDKPAHDGFDGRSRIVKVIRSHLKDRMLGFAEDIEVIKRRETADNAPSEADRRTLQFVFESLSPGAFGNSPNDANGTNDPEDADANWDVAVMLKYPSANSTCVRWGEKIENIRLVVKSQPKTVRRNTRLALEWRGPGENYSTLSEYKHRKGVEYALRNQLLTRDWIDEPHIICPKPGLYRIRAAVYEGRKLVATDPRKIHVEIDQPEPKKRPYFVRISVDNESNPREKRISDGDTLKLKIYGRNRTHHDVSGQLFLRMKEGTILAQHVRFAMEGTPLGGDDSPQLLYELPVKTIKGDSTRATTRRDLLTLQLETGESTIQAYLLDGDDQLAYGSEKLHFETDPAQTSGGYPFELQPIVVGTPPMWELDMAKQVLNFAAKHPLSEDSPNTTITANGELHGAYMLEVCICGLLQWALEPLLEVDSDHSNIETLRESKHNFPDEDAWDTYMDRLSALETLTLKVNAGEVVSPLEYDLRWRSTVAAVHEVLNAEESA